MMRMKSGVSKAASWYTIFLWVSFFMMSISWSMYFCRNGFFLICALAMTLTANICYDDSEYLNLNFCGRAGLLRRLLCRWSEPLHSLCPIGPFSCLRISSYPLYKKENNIRIYPQNLKPSWSKLNKIDYYQLLLKDDIAIIVVF